MKKFAFTLTELLLATTIIGIIAAIGVVNIQRSNTGAYTKAGKTQVYRAIEAVQQASSDIMISETTNCPMGAFMVKIAGSWQTALSGIDSSQGVYNLYKKHIKFQEDINYCSYTSKCNDTNIKGGILPGDVYIGFEYYTSAKGCPNYYDPATAGLVTGRGTCWGALLVKLMNSHLKTDTWGKDVFIFGLNEKGVAF